MYEVFNYITGETVGYTDNLRSARIATKQDRYLDYCDADAEPSGIIIDGLHQYQ